MTFKIYNKKTQSTNNSSKIPYSQTSASLKRLYFNPNYRCFGPALNFYRTIDSSLIRNFLYLYRCHPTRNRPYHPIDRSTINNLKNQRKDTIKVKR